MKQQSLASQAVFEKYGRKSRRELFLDEMEQVVPWSGLQSLVEPPYAKAGNGRRPVGLGIMLRTYFVQQWFNDYAIRVDRSNGLSETDIHPQRHQPLPRGFRELLRESGERTSAHVRKNDMG